MKNEEKDLQRSNNLYDAIVDLPDELVNKAASFENVKVNSQKKKIRNLRITL